jgi:hypothetical protein
VFRKNIVSFTFVMSTTITKNDEVKIQLKDKSIQPHSLAKMILIYGIDTRF